jgi:hypothetical protein
MILKFARGVVEQAIANLAGHARIVSLALEEGVPGRSLVVVAHYGEHLLLHSRKVQHGGVLRMYFPWSIPACVKPVKESDRWDTARIRPR